MRICLVGDFSLNLDEGYKNISHMLASQLSKRNDVTRLNIKAYRSTGFWKTLNKCDPEIIHLITQPTNVSLLFAGLIRRSLPKAKLIISAQRPHAFFSNNQVNWFQKQVLKFSTPDIVFVHTSTAEKEFGRLNLRALYLPNGVDINRFKPVNYNTRLLLREQYGVATDRPVILHVGHLAPARNLSLLKPLPQCGYEVVVAGSLYMGIQTDLIKDLECAGIKIFKGYQSQVDHLYQLSDIYVFPLIPGNSISMPLSVLEAMATNLLVITSRFDGLVSNFSEGDGLLYFDPQNDDLLSIISSLLQSRIAPETRNKVLSYSWDSIADELDRRYSELVRK